MFKSEIRKWEPSQWECKCLPYAICAQYRLCEYQSQLILLSLVSVFNIFIYLLKRVKGVNSPLIVH